MELSENILGINERNLELIYRYNKHQHYPIADNKLLTKKVLHSANIPTPKLLHSYSYFYELNQLKKDLWNQANFVIKPARGLQGGGILVFDRFDNGDWLTTSRTRYSHEDIFEHATEILYGVYSLDKTSDAVLIEEKVQVNEFLKKIAYRGIPDVRVIIFKQRPIMAMLRVPTKRSDGRANLHTGGIGVSIDLHSGVTQGARFMNRRIDRHPDTAVKLSGIRIPYWEKVLDFSRWVQNYVPLQYLGIDFVIDKRYGPQVLELNGRPGLEIQNINNKGLKNFLIQHKKYS